MYKNIKLRIAVFIFSLIILTACSSSKFEYKDVVLDEEKTEEIPVDNSTPNAVVSVDKMYSWIDLLPGPDQVPRFQITGSISIPKSENYDLDDVKLKIIKIYQNGHPYFYIKPTIRDNKREKSEFQKEFLFSTIVGVKLVPGFNKDENIDVEFIFDNDGDLLSYKVPDQTIEQAN